MTEPTMKAYEPTWRDRLARALMGDERASPAKRGLINGFLGSTGLGTTGLGLVDLTPAGNVLGAQEEAKRGNMREAAMNAMFLGPAARTADHVALTLAQRMAEKGASREAIHAETGWFTGADGKWRFEVPDNAASVAGQGNFSGPLDKALSHKEIFDAYPDLNKIDASLNVSGVHPRGSFQTATVDGVPIGGGYISAGGPNVGDVRSALLHETQHAVQNVEGFAKGADPQMYARLSTPYPARTFESAQFVKDQAAAAGITPQAMRFQMELKGSPIIKDVPNLEDALTLKDDVFNRYLTDSRNAANPMDAYRRTAGEVEARNVQTRMNMTPEERLAKPPWETQDVPDAQQIIRGIMGR